MTVLRDAGYLFTINPFIHALSCGAWIAGGTEASFPIASFRKRGENSFECAFPTYERWFVIPHI